MIWVVLRGFDPGRSQIWAISQQNESIWSGDSVFNWTQQRPRSRAVMLGGVTAGAAVLSYGVQVILGEGVDGESVCRRSDGSDWKAAGATSG